MKLNLRVIAPIGLLVGLLLFVQTKIIVSPETVRVQYVPDDAYYYLTLARHFATSGAWTFDGVNVTCGFHPCWAYVLAGVYWLIRPSDGNFVSIGMMLSGLLMLAVLVALEISMKRERVPVLLAGLVFVTSPWFIYNSVSVSEWSLALVCSYLFFRVWFQQPAKPKLLFALAVVGTLVRTDFIVLPILFCTIGSFVDWRHQRFPLERAVAAAGGVVVGLTLLGLHNYVLTGELLQSSLAMKLHWARSHRTGGEYEMALVLVARVFGFENLSISSMERIFVLLTGIGLFTLSITRKDKKGSAQLIMAMVALWAYTLLYCQTGSVQMWYTANLIVPGFVLVSISAKSIGDRYGMICKVLIGFLLTVLIYRNGSNVGTGEKNRVSPYPHQAVMLEAGKYLSKNDVGGKVASWNAGIIGYYAGGRVTNLDGLVNNGIHRSISGNRLREYLEQNGISYIIDFQNMLGQYYCRRGGYADLDFLARLKPVKVFDNGQYSWRYLTLWRYEERSLR